MTNQLEQWSQLAVGQKVFGFGNNKDEDYGGTVVKLTDEKMVVELIGSKRKTFNRNHRHDEEPIDGVLFVTYKKGRQLVSSSFVIGTESASSRLRR
jgi:hypothetical protein